MNDADIADRARSLSKRERLILATYEGESCLHEGIGRHWDARALENLILQEIIRRTISGYELSEEGMLLAKFIHDHEVAGNLKNSKNRGGLRGMTFGEPCPKCGTELAKIKRETLDHIIEFLHPTFYSVSQRQINGKRAWIPICPQCDAYALGIEFEAGFPFILKNGQESEIQQIVDMLWQPEPFRSENLAGVEIIESGGKARVIPFPKYTVPTIDWNEIEQIRADRYSGIPVQLFDVLKSMMMSTPSTAASYEFQLESYSDDLYPPQEIPIIPGKACVLWLMDLLDRFGGGISYDGLTCTVDREKPKHPVFQVTPISREQFSGINGCLENYEFFIRNSSWKIFSKNLDTVNLVILFAKDLADEDRIFQGMFDTNTFNILRERLLENKQPWSEILLFDV